MWSEERRGAGVRQRKCLENGALTLVHPHLHVRRRLFNGQESFMTHSMDAILYYGECYHIKNKVHHYSL